MGTRPRTSGFSAAASSCHNFGEAAAVFRISYTEAKALFSGQTGPLVTPNDVSEHISAFLARPPESTEAVQHSRRQAVIDGLLVKANRAAQTARRGVTALMAVFF